MGLCWGGGVREEESEQKTSTTLQASSFKVDISSAVVAERVDGSECEGKI